MTLACSNLLSAARALQGLVGPPSPTGLTAAVDQEVGHGAAAGVAGASAIDWARLLADVVGSVAWPVTVFVVVLMFRKTLTERLASVLHAKFPGVELKLGELRRLAEEQQADTPQPAVPEPPVEPDGPPTLAVVDLRLELERHLLRLVHAATGTGPAHRGGVFGLVETVERKQLIDSTLLTTTRQFLQLSQHVERGAAVPEDAVVLGSSVLSRIKHEVRVAELMREMDGNLMWQYRDFEDRGYDPRHHYFSAVVEGMPRFDYSYEALAEAVERTNTGGKARRRSELPIVRPTQEEYLELLRFREEEVERVLALADKHDGSIHTKEAEWKWPEAWEPIIWNGPVYREGKNRGTAAELERELLHARSAIRHYTSLWASQLSEEGPKLEASPVGAEAKAPSR